MPIHNLVEVGEEDDLIEINSTAGLITVLTRIIENAAVRNTNIHDEMVSNRVFSFDHLPNDKIHVFSVLLNNIICLYHIAGHKQLVEVRNKHMILFNFALFIC